MYIYSRISCRSFLMDLTKAPQSGRWSLFRPRGVRQWFKHGTYINTRGYTGEEFCSAFPVISDISKFRDPLHLLSDYIAEVGTACLGPCFCSSYCVWFERQLYSKQMIAVKYSFMTMTWWGSTELVVALWVDSWIVAHCSPDVGSCWKPSNRTWWRISSGNPT
jgi:hypothetical protein